MEVSYNLWHGCHKKSEGCLNCYVYRNDEKYGRDSSVVYKTKAFNEPILKKKNGDYKYPSGTLFDLCFTSDFFLEEADAFREDALKIIQKRSDCIFFMITKRPERIMECLKDPCLYPNLMIHCTMENQRCFDERAPIYLNLPLKHKGIAIAPMLGPIDLGDYLKLGVNKVTVDGESGPNARLLDFEWVKDIKRQCEKAQVPFQFRQTGARIKVDGKIYSIPRKEQFRQAKKAFKD